MNGPHKRAVVAAIAAAALATSSIPGAAQAAQTTAARLSPVTPRKAVPPVSASMMSAHRLPAVDCRTGRGADNLVRALLAAERRDTRTYRRAALPAPGASLTPALPAAPGGARGLPPDTPAGAATALDTCRSAPDRTADDGRRTVPGGGTAPREGTAPATDGGRVRHGAARSGGTPGAAGLGDSYFPQAGNGGYDVDHYDVRLRYDEATRQVDTTVTITARARQALSSFHLDYRGPAITDVTVDGRTASNQRDGQELTVTPAATIIAGSTFTTVIHYTGIPGPLHQSTLGTYGWVQTRDGAVVLGEPDGAPSWLPVNDHPKDKATYRFKVTVPGSLQVVANGEPGPVTAGQDGTTTYEWNERSPMASYLATVAIGRFTILKGVAGSIPVVTAVDPAFAKDAQKLHATTIAALNWESAMFGPYPFRTSGGIIDDPDLGYALETQERPVYAGFSPDPDFVVHELAHQWFGDSVSLTDWQDIWLNEGFATYAEWLWRERTKADAAKKTFMRYYRQPANSPIFTPPPGRPGRDALFGFSVYIRGAMCLEALRERVGDPAFFQILRQWAAEHRQGNATTAQFVNLSQRVSGKRLGKLFHAWLFTNGKPKAGFAMGGPKAGSAKGRPKARPAAGRPKTR